MTTDKAKYCKKCDEQIPSFGIDSLYEVCDSCRWKTERNTYIVLGVFALSVIIGARIAWAKFVYHDIRCVFAECRLIPDNKQKEEVAGKYTIHSGGTTFNSDFPIEDDRTLTQAQQACRKIGFDTFESYQEQGSGFGLFSVACTDYPPCQGIDDIRVCRKTN